MAPGSRTRRLAGASAASRVALPCRCRSPSGPRTSLASPCSSPTSGRTSSSPRRTCTPERWKRCRSLTSSRPDARTSSRFLRPGFFEHPTRPFRTRTTVGRRIRTSSGTRFACGRRCACKRSGGRWLASVSTAPRSRPTTRLRLTRIANWLPGASGTRTIASLVSCPCSYTGSFRRSNTSRRIACWTHSLQASRWLSSILARRTSPPRSTASIRGSLAAISAA
mmetsp:Transcript_87846/g.268822  ORF Transcript_87846/g.268822 Transcript_87846/m.268822 type:complete len:223 (-) Transcript_87846:2296-2964(-)